MSFNRLSLDRLPGKKDARSIIHDTPGGSVILNLHVAITAPKPPSQRKISEMAKLPHKRTRLPGVDRFDIELNAFLYSRGFLVFFSNHPSRPYYFADDAASPVEMSRAFYCTLRLALIDPDTDTEPTCEKLDDGLASLGARNLYSPNLQERIRAYEAAQEAEYQARQADRMPEDI